MTTTTKRTGHTPGPWVVTENKRERTTQVDTADGRGTVVQPNAISWRPDAALVAAAPELLAALRGVLLALGMAASDGILPPASDPALVAAREAIAKATGGSR